jgi:hypothetical protein
VQLWQGKKQVKGDKNECKLWPFFNRCRRQCLNFFSAVSESTKKYKLAISGLNHENFEYFGLVSKSPIHTGLICVKTPEPNISSLGPFKAKKP